MNKNTIYSKLKKLKRSIKGDVFFDEISKIIYSTDASAYKEKPTGIILPKDIEDLKAILAFAAAENAPIIPRTAGTSLAGQVVGNGLIVDVSKYMTQILELNVQEQWVRVQPGVVLDELNKYLEPHGLFFGPETSTANRCMIGGMLGNNACGSHSLIYGSTRDHTLSAKVLLTDGSEVEFGAITNEQFFEKCKLNTFEGKLYQHIHSILSPPDNQTKIREEYPDLKVKRRNTGYAIDLLLHSKPFNESGEQFNFCKLLAGSEGTLAFTTEIKLNLVSIPPPEKAVMAVHLKSLREAMRANLIALKFNPGAVELMDKTILDLTKGNIEQQKNRFFIDGEPAAILIIEFARNSKEEIIEIAANLESAMKESGYGYSFPMIWGKDISKVWNLRKSGLGVLSNMEGDAKPVSVIEDTAINPEKLPDYIDDFNELMTRYNLNCVYHAHIGTGELHLRPILNLKLKKDVELFRIIALETAKLVKKYNGSLSGEHGDGRLRGEFIPLMIGEHNYNLLKEIKQIWDPQHLMNPGKIVHTPAMNSSLRYTPGEKTKEIPTIFDFSNSQGIMRAVEKCNGSADCRKTAIIGGTMCPSFMASGNEMHTTRARANVLREMLSSSQKDNPFDSQEIYEIMDLCLSCKACKSECPSSVDIAKLKAEFLQHYYDSNGIPTRTRLIANITRINQLASLVPSITNFFLKSSIIKRIIGFAPERNMPLLYKFTLQKWYKHNYPKYRPVKKLQIVYLLCDEFTNYNDVEIGIKTIIFLSKLGYEVMLPNIHESGRTYLSKGLVRKAKQIATKNLKELEGKISEHTPFLGIEPSAILTFRDEYPDLFSPQEHEFKSQANYIAKNSFLVEEFISKKIQDKVIDQSLFVAEKKQIKLHGHCQQKSIASTNPTKEMLSFPANYSVEEIPSGCCGMAGSFGYEQEHYELSMKVGELVLFPELRKQASEILIAAPGTSCRHQIFDGTGKKALHPIEIMYEALIEK